MTRRWRQGVVAVAILTVATLYYLFNPLESRWAPKCAFHALTGLECPGCGSQRMLHALLHGDLSAAWSANPFLLLALPFLALLVYASFRRTAHPRLYACLNSLPAIIFAVVAMIGWSVYRNIFL